MNTGAVAAPARGADEGLWCAEDCRAISGLSHTATERRGYSRRSLRKGL
jgi:hypothetical protein